MAFESWFDIMLDRALRLGVFHTPNEFQAEYDWWIEWAQKEFNPIPIEASTFRENFTGPAPIGPRQGHLSNRDGGSHSTSSLSPSMEPSRAEATGTLSPLTENSTLGNIPLDLNIPLATESDPCKNLDPFFASQDGWPRFSALCKQSNAHILIMRPIFGNSDVEDVSKFAGMFPRKLRFRTERQSQGLLIWMELHKRYRSSYSCLSPDLRQVLEDAHCLLTEYADLTTTPLPTLYEFALQYFKDHNLKYSNPAGPAPKRPRSVSASRQHADRRGSQHRGRSRSRGDHWPPKRGALSKRSIPSRVRGSKRRRS